MSGDCLHDTVGCMAFYTLKPFLICHAILSTTWKAARLVQGLAAGNASLSAAQMSTPVPVGQTFQPRAPPRHSSGHLVDRMLEQQLAQMEAEKAQQRWSNCSLPSYRRYDDDSREQRRFQLAVEEGYSQKFWHSGTVSEKEIKIVVYPVDEESSVDIVSPLGRPVPTMQYIPVAA